ncbi:MAG: tungstate ABC transporter substrate-binding protein WtpA [Chloroflexota bacterium]
MVAGMRTSGRLPHHAVPCLLLLSILLLVTPPAHASGGPVSVFYAGSLVNVNETLVGPAFSAADGYTYQGKGAGSLAIAAQIKGKLATPDVVELADPTVNQLLSGPANGDYVSWYLTFARSELVVGFDPRSHFARAFRQVQHHKLAWYKALQQRGLRLGRTDPNLDPKGYRALFMAGLAERVFHLHNFGAHLLGSATNPSQIFPEEVLVARMLTGQIDAGIFYLSEVKDLGIPYISLPATVNLGAPKYARLYRTQSFTTSKGITVTGAPILYTITIVSGAKNLEGAQAFVRFVLGKRVRAIAAMHGLLPLRITIGGRHDQVPSSILDVISRQ